MLLSRILFAFLFVSSLSIAPKERSLNYIDQYNALAIAEMHRTGIPASIKLAQGLVESRYGTSSLAINANNHFGIKCKNYWRGETYYHKDDDYDKYGNLMKSCFRAYETPVDSYVDHSNFLSMTKHYQVLFSLEQTDYLGWAHGLKKCGYATDPNYALKLIRKIEEFKLYEFDIAKNPGVRRMNLSPASSGE